MSAYDIIIIGSGPGGYVSALYAAGLGKKVLVVEKDRIGGVCLNWGCIPTKALIASAEALSAVKRCGEFGISVSSATADYGSIKKRKDDIVATLKKGIESLFKAKKIDLEIGHGRILDKGVVDVNGKRFESKDIIIATGTRPADIPGVVRDGKRILSSADMLEIDHLPRNLLIIGGGVNGCEYAYIFRSLGSEVTIVEVLDRLLPAMDAELGKQMEMLLKKIGVKVMTKTRLDGVPAEYDTAAVCAGRRYNSEDLGLEKLDIRTEKGRIIVDGNMMTNVPGIYAAGDATGGYLLAHVASHEGISACNAIAGRPSPIDYRSIPICIYTSPQIAAVGMGEEEARAKGLDIKVSKFQFRGIGKAHASGEKDGYVKIIGDSRTEDVLGVQMVGHEVTELAAEAALAIKARLKIKDIRETIHAHPTMSEGIMEAAFAFSGTPLHAL